MILEIGISLVGIAVFAAGFIIPERIAGNLQSTANDITSEKLKSMIEEEINQVKLKVDTILENTVDEVAEQTEKSLEKITNDKIMAVNEYADGVLNEIQKTYNEVMFLYSMLNDKEKDLKDIVLKIQSMPDKKEEEQPKSSDTDKIPQEETVEINNKNSYNQASAMYEKKKKMEKYDIKNNNGKILSLHKDGKNEIEIAKQLGLGVGEVRLVLDLFKGARG